MHSKGFPGSSVVKEPACKGRRWQAQSLGREDLLEEGLAPLEGTRRVRGLLGLVGRLSGTVSPFRAEQGTSLETPQNWTVMKLLMRIFRKKSAFL